jgi:phosphotransacetylase
VLADPEHVYPIRMEFACEAVRKADRFTRTPNIARSSTNSGGSSEGPTPHGAKRART